MFDISGLPAGIVRVFDLFFVDENGRVAVPEIPAIPVGSQKKPRVRHRVRACRLLENGSIVQHRVAMN